MKPKTPQATRAGHPGSKRGFGGGRYAAPYSGSYGGEFRTDYRGLRGSSENERFPAGKDGDPKEEPVDSNYGGLRHTGPADTDDGKDLKGRKR